MSSPLHFLASGPGDPAWNMALDEALLVSAAPRGIPVLRLYGWTEPAATFGYFQKLAEVERVTLLRPLIRRPTGGGIVPHDRDWTYSLSVPPDHSWYRLTAVESYRQIHAWVVDALAGLGLHAELAPECRCEIPGQCFRGWEKFDVLQGGRKIGGAAQRRNRLGLLIQGSVQPARPEDRAAWELAFARTAPAKFFGSTARIELEPSTRTLAHELAESKYRQAAYNASR